MTKEISLSGPSKMHSVSSDIVAKSEALAEGQLVLVYGDSTIPLRRSVAVPVKAGLTELCLQLVFSPDIQLAKLTLPVNEKSKINLGTLTYLKKKNNHASEVTKYRVIQIYVFFVP